MFGKADLVLANPRDIWKTILSYSVNWAKSQAYPTLVSGKTEIWLIGVWFGVKRVP